MKIIFPGGKKVFVETRYHTIETDQPVQDGGEGSAPAPFTLFLASLGSCAGIYVLSFCQQRGIATEGISMSMHTKKDESTHMITEISLDIELPDDFPAKYKSAVIKAASQCTVKKHLLNPPHINITTS